jgi:hypothetical protein
MKKWIPKNTIYCYDYNGLCKWHKYIKTVKLNKSNCESANTCKHECWSSPNTSCKIKIYKCEYLNFTDWNEDSYLWDQCKECGEHDNINDLRWFKKR